jgi:LacI family transcriptional regulator
MFRISIFHLAIGQIASLCSVMVTQEQIADKLGISRQLVTLALANHPNVSTKSRERILTAARKMGYAPNPHSRALKGGRTRIIALWIPDQISSHYAHVSQELNRLVKREQYELIIHEVGSGMPEQIMSHVPMDGIIVVDAIEAAQSRLRSAGGNKIPAIYMGYEEYEGKSDHIYIDLFNGALEAMKHLIQRGFRRILHVTVDTQDVPNRPRRRAYLEAMKQAGLKPEFLYVPLGEQLRPMTRQLIQDYILNKDYPDAIFCNSDDIALGVYRGLCDLKLRMPQNTVPNVALVGCDGIPYTEYLETPLTTIAQPVIEMCDTAWRFLQRRLESPDLPPQRETLLTKLVIRESSMQPSV